MGNRQRRDKRAVASLGENVVLFREAGFSFGAIAKHFGISKAYAVKLVQERYAELRRTRANHVALTARQRRFARALINGRSPREAALFAALPGKLSPEEAREWAHMTMLTTNFRLAIGQIFRLDEPKASGGTTENPVATHADGDASPARPCEEEEDDDVVVYLD